MGVVTVAINTGVIPSVQYKQFASAAGQPTRHNGDNNDGNDCGDHNSGDDNGDYGNTKTKF